MVTSVTCNQLLEKWVARMVFSIILNFAIRN